MIVAIEDAFVDRIRSASECGLLGYRLKTVDLYGGLFDDADEVKRAIPNMPAAWVFFLDEKPERVTGNGKWEMGAEFSVLVATTSKRNESDRRHGTAGAVGVYQMARDARTLLTDQTLGLDIGRVEFTRTRPVRLSWMTALGVSALGVDFKVSYELLAAPDAGAAALAAGIAEGNPTLMAAMNRAAGITDFALVQADWQAPLNLSATVYLETAP
jgi:phage gp37-like protein